VDGKEKSTGRYNFDICTTRAIPARFARFFVASPLKSEPDGARAGAISARQLDITRDRDIIIGYFWWRSDHAFSPCGSRRSNSQFESVLSSSIPGLIAGSPVAAETSMRARRNPRWVLKAPRLDLRPRRVSTPIDCTVAQSSLSLCFKQSERRLNCPGFNERSESPAKLRQGLPVREGPNHPIPDP